MKVEILENSVARKLIRLKNKRCPDAKRWFIKATYWDDGDYELTLRASWGNIFHDFIYRKSMDKYYYCLIDTEKYKNLEELK